MKLESMATNGLRESPTGSQEMEKDPKEDKERGRLPCDILSFVWSKRTKEKWKDDSDGCILQRMDIDGL